MSAPARVRALLERTPLLSSRQIAEALGYSDRHVRRILRDLPGMAAHRSGRAICYTITTTGRADPGRTPGQIADMPDIGDMADIRGSYTPRKYMEPGSAKRRPGEDLQWNNSGHDSGQSPGEQRSLRPSFPQPGTPRYGDAPIGPQDEAHASRLNRPGITGPIRFGNFSEENL